MLYTSAITCTLCKRERTPIPVDKGKLGETAYVKCECGAWLRTHLRPSSQKIIGYVAKVKDSRTCEMYIHIVCINVREVVMRPVENEEDAHLFLDRDGAEYAAQAWCDAVNSCRSLDKYNVSEVYAKCEQ